MVNHLSVWVPEWLSKTELPNSDQEHRFGISWSKKCTSISLRTKWLRFWGLSIRWVNIFLIQVTKVMSSLFNWVLPNWEVWSPKTQNRIIYKKWKGKIHTLQSDPLESNEKAPTCPFYLLSCHSNWSLSWTWTYHMTFVYTASSTWITHLAQEDVLPSCPYIYYMPPTNTFLSCYSAVVPITLWKWSFYFFNLFISLSLDTRSFIRIKTLFVLAIVVSPAPWTILINTKDAQWYLLNEWMRERGNIKERKQQ